SGQYSIGVVRETILFRSTLRLLVYGDLALHKLALALDDEGQLIADLGARNDGIRIGAGFDGRSLQFPNYVAGAHAGAVGGAAPVDLLDHRAVQAVQPQVVGPLAGEVLRVQAGPRALDLAVLDQLRGDGAGEIDRNGEPNALRVLPHHGVDPDDVAVNVHQR